MFCRNNTYFYNGKKKQGCGYRSHGVETIGAVHGKDVYFMHLVARRRVLAPTSERSTVLGFALRGIKHTSFPDEADL